jgi:hypothetical protein
MTAAKSDEEWETDDEEANAKQSGKHSVIRKTPDTTFSVSLEQSSLPAAETTGVHHTLV